MTRRLYIVVAVYTSAGTTNVQFGLVVDAASEADALGKALLQWDAVRDGAVLAAHAVADATDTARQWVAANPAPEPA